MCKISIIVPLYNGKKTIKRCLDSLISQTFQDIEILVINDGSQDGGEEIVRQYMMQDKRIRLFNQKNAGQGAARNYGISKSVGEYIGFVDCDDFVDTNMYKIMINAIVESGATIAICQEKNVYFENNHINYINETNFPTKQNNVYTKEEILNWFLNFSYLSLNSLCYKLIKKSFIEEYEIRIPENHRYAEDLIMSAVLFSYVDRVVIIPKSLYYYVHTKDSFTYNYSLKNAVDVYIDWKEIKMHLEKIDYKGNMDNFSLGMKFSSLKQLYWACKQGDKNCFQAKKLKKLWKDNQKHQKWRPIFKKNYVPISHKLKICTAYFHAEKIICSLIENLKWIPFFDFMT